VKGTVNKRPTRGGRPKWEYCFDLGKDPATGRRRRVTKSGFKTQRDAENAMADAIREYRDQPAAKEETPMPAFAEFFARWHSEVARRNCERKTWERYEQLGQYAIRLYGNTPLDQLSTEQLTVDQGRMLDHGGQVTKKYAEGKPLAPKTVRHVSFLVQACLEQAVDWDYITKNPMRKVKKPKVPKRKPKVVDRDGLDSLVTKAMDLSVYPIIVLGVATGMRRGEMLALEWSDVDWEAGTVEVSKSLEETEEGLRVKSTKSGEPRDFPLPVPADVLEVLREHKREQDHQRAVFGPGYINKNLIFARPDGNWYSPDKVGTRIGRVMRKAGLEGVSLHSLRHSYATEQISKGTPITTVSKILGHASVNVTLGIYSHALPKDNQTAGERWNDNNGEVIRRSLERRIPRTCSLTANDSAGSEKIRIIPIKSAS
jgi:integrase